MSIDEGPFQNIIAIDTGPTAGGQLFHFALGVSNKSETPEDLSLGPACGWDLYPTPPTPPQPPAACTGEPVGWCPSIDFQSKWCTFNGTGVYQLDTSDLAILVQLNPSNFPAVVYDFNGTQVQIIPALQCSPYQAGYTEIIDDDEAWDAEWSAVSEFTRFTWCGLTHSDNVPSIGEDTLSLDCTPATWPISSVDEGLGRIYFAADTHLKVFDVVQIQSTIYEVFDVETNGAWIETVPAPTASLVGADVLFIPGIYTEKGTYSSVTDLGDGTVAMNVGAHNVEVGWVFTAWGSDNYFEDYYEVLDVTETTIIIEEFYEPESGQWGAGANVYDVVTYP